MAIGINQGFFLGGVAQGREAAANRRLQQRQLDLQQQRLEQDLLQQNFVRTQHLQSVARQQIAETGKLLVDMKQQFLGTSEEFEAQNSETIAGMLRQIDALAQGADLPNAPSRVRMTLGAARTAQETTTGAAQLQVEGQAAAETALIEQGITPQTARTKAFGITPTERFVTMKPDELKAAGFAEGAIVQVNNQTGEFNVIKEGGGPLDASDRVNLETKLRVEFTNLTDDFRDIRDSYSKILAAADTPSAAGDLAIIFSYMKILDPTSVVREGEQASAANAAGVPDRVRALYNRLLTGERLAEEQRGDFVNTAGELYGAALQQFQRDENRYRELAELNDLDVDRVVHDVSGGVTPVSLISGTTGDLPPGIPEGSKLIGRLDGFPVYETPDGKRIQVKQ